jgi:hypothetical protein
MQITSPDQQQMPLEVSLESDQRCMIPVHMQFDCFRVLCCKSDDGDDTNDMSFSLNSIHLIHSTSVLPKGSTAQLQTPLA